MGVIAVPCCSADEVIATDSEDIAERVKAITGEHTRPHE